MKPVITTDFFYYDTSFTKKHNAFTDDAVFSKEQRLEFLTRYANHLKDYYDLPKEAKKVVEPSESEWLLSQYSLFEPFPKLSQRIDFARMHASLKMAACKYANWMLYTPYTEIYDNTVVFRAHHLPPTPAAKYTFDSKKRLREFSFSFFMDDRYNAEIPGGILHTTPGRTVEFRSGIHDILKLQFYPNGTCCVRLGNSCPYHLENIPIGSFGFSAWQSITVYLYEDSFEVNLNGKISERFPISYQDSPDTIFFDSGMFHVGEWRLKPLTMRFDECSQTEFFKPIPKRTEPIADDLGEIELPCCVGGYENRDKMLVLKKVFTVPSGKTVHLKTDSLDPHGCVYINGRIVLDTNGFEAYETDITPYIKEGENLIEINVYPRAPQVLFNWHRLTDAYNGWFCENVSLFITNEVTIRKVEALTEKVCENHIRCTFSADFSQNGFADIYIKKIFPVEAEEEVCLGRYIVSSKRLKETICFEGESWSPDCPVLYAVRVAFCNQNGEEIDDYVIETGFRTIAQKNGELLLNGKAIILTGALLMQFLPPYHETPVTHICSHSDQILWQEMMVKRLGGNTMRMHILGYGSNDRRFARFADRLGLLLIWTTRFIDSVEQLMLEDEWAAKEAYIRQIKARINHPSIIMWEGANEYHPSLRDIDKIYKNFVQALKPEDPLRLLSPVSHLYYAGDMIPMKGCAFYNDNGNADHEGNPVAAPPEWNDPQVVRSAHTYEILLGYGTDWEKMRTQNWSMQPELFDSQNHAYLVTEFAVIGRANPNVPEARLHFNAYSYELPDEDVLGFRFSSEQWSESQAYQALAAKYATRILHLKGADGMLWCCLMSGANDGGYLKPPIDSYGYPKLAFYTLRDGFRALQVISEDLDVLKPKDFNVRPIIVGAHPNRTYLVTASILDENHRVVESKEYTAISGEDRLLKLSIWTPRINQNGYYTLQYELKEL